MDYSSYRLDCALLILLSHRWRSLVLATPHDGTLFGLTSNRMYLNRSLKAYSLASSLTSSVEEELELGFSGLVYSL